jgi:hypothetical protein
MTDKYDNLAQVHADSELLLILFEKLLHQSFSPKFCVEPSILAACIRLLSSDHNLDYFGSYLQKRFQSNASLYGALPEVLIQFLSQNANQNKPLFIARYVIQSCKNSRPPLAIG